MKTFKQFLSEEKKFKELAKVLKDECGPWFAAAGDAFAYRGIKKESVESAQFYEVDGVNFGVKKVRQDRKPRDMKGQLHSYIDHWFDDKFGLRPRSKGMFCYGESGKDETQHYGLQYVVVPIGDFKFVWSDEVKDLQIVLDDMVFDRDYKDQLEEFLESSEYTTRNLKTALSSESEIMIICDSYYFFSTDDRDKIKKAMS